MYFAEFCDIIEDGLLYIFQSGGLSGGKSASLGHISGWDRVSSTGMSRCEVSYRKEKRGKIMTIVEAIIHVLNDNSSGLTVKEIYSKIIESNLYSFGARDPIGVVNSQIRRSCLGIDFPSARPTKLFKVVGYEKSKPLYANINDIETNYTEPKQTQDVSDLLPEEKMNKAHNEHIDIIKQQIFDFIMDNSFSFFEHLVVDLLIAMGYGYDHNSGVVTGRSHDGGIDGIINEDKLGLDLIYVQAKRYSNKNTVGRKELQAFIGAMEHVQKGVFITTSSFTKEALKFIEKQQQKSIKLIDGKFLAELLVKYQVGISTVKNFAIYKIDTDYYSK